MYCVQCETNLLPEDFSPAERRKDPDDGLICYECNRENRGGSQPNDVAKRSIQQVFKARWFRQHKMEHNDHE